MRQLALLLTGLAILAGINFTVWRYEAAMTSGEVVLLRLAPVDPRSLMLNTELMLHLSCPALCAELRHWLCGWQRAAVHPVVAPPSTLRRLLARLSDWLPLRPWL